MGGRKIKNRIKRNRKNIYQHEYDFQGKLPHVGVVVFGQEYSYTTKGIEIIEPGTWGNSEVKLKTLEGRTIRTQDEIDKFLKRIEFSGYFYSFLNLNCINFANVFVKFLRGKDITIDKIRNIMYVVLNINPLNYLLNRALGAGFSSIANTDYSTQAEFESKPSSKKKSKSKNKSIPKAKSNLKEKSCNKKIMK